MTKGHCPRFSGRSSLEPQIWLHSTSPVMACLPAPSSTSFINPLETFIQLSRSHGWRAIGIPPGFTPDRGPTNPLGGHPRRVQPSLPRSVRTGRSPLSTRHPLQLEHRPVSIYAPPSHPVPTQLFRLPTILFGERRRSTPTKYVSEIVGSLFPCGPLLRHTPDEARPVFDRVYGDCQETQRCTGVHLLLAGRRQLYVGGW